MLVLGLVGVAVPFGAAVAVIVNRWPARDPAALKLPRAEIRAVVGRHRRLREHLRARFDPVTATGIALIWTLLVFVGVASVIGVLAAMVRANAGLARYDPRIAEWAARHATPSSSSSLRFISQFGGALVVIPLAFVVAVVESRRLRRGAVWPFLLLVVGGQFMLANSIKFIVGRARPAIDQLTGFSGKSFPSGHATAAAATYAAFALLFGIRRSVRFKALGAGFAVAFAILIAGTRVLLGVHWLTDVIAGLVLGWGWFAVCSIAFGGRLLRFAAPIEIAEQVAASPQPAVATTSD
jgi:membrane-associated phospholipid phosphatase